VQLLRIFWYKELSELPEAVRLLLSSWTSLTILSSFRQSEFRFSKLNHDIEEIVRILLSWKLLMQESAVVMSPCLSFRQNLSIIIGAGGTRP
jgi:hypothetical protein